MIPQPAPSLDQISQWNSLNEKDSIIAVVHFRKAISQRFGLKY